MSEDIFSQFFNLFNNNDSDVNWELSKQINKHLNKDSSEEILELSNDQLDLNEIFRFLELNIHNVGNFDSEQTSIQILEPSLYGEWFLNSIQHFDFSKFSIGDLPGGLQIGNIQSSIIGMQLGNLAGMIAIVQDDLKKVLAYSTVSQLGYMVAAIGSGAYTAALFHLWTHAFFKALLFLGAGSVIHAVHTNSMKEMGGLRKEMPRTYTTFILGTIALTGLPPLAGFFSKDEILASLNHGGYNTYFAIAVSGAFITAFYMTRAVVLTFFGEYRGNGHPHESDSMMTTPLIVLAGFAVTAGWVNIPGIYTGFTDWVTTRKNPIVEYHPESFDYFALTSGLLAGLAGIGLAYYVYQILGRPEDGDEKIKVEPIWNLLENKYYLDDFYFKYIINPTKSTLANTVDRFNTNILDKAVNLFGVAAIFLGNIVYNKFDQGGIDKALNISSSSTDALGARVKLLQTGKAQQYIMYFLSGVIVISLLILLVL
ncbi:proton-conducting transporter membrane subunit [Candidatus Actinomarina sp.]|nr:proton-conducting transporter membrane subunit [Candidatus Actinomarina sp.]